MARLTAIDPTQATGKAKQLLDNVQAKLGITPNMMRTMASSPAVLDAYLHFSGSLAGGKLDAKFREQIAIAIAQANSCECCLSAHTTIGQMVGLTPEELAASRLAQSADAKRNAGLRFAQAVLVSRGRVSDAELDEVKAAGYSEGEIAEIVANVAVNIFTNYFNELVRTEVDFPKVSLTLTANA